MTELQITNWPIFVELQNIDLNIINILVELYLQEGEYQKAMEVINPVVETVQQVPIEITVHLATCVAHLGTPDQAIVCFFFQYSILSRIYLFCK